MEKPKKEKVMAYRTQKQQNCRNKFYLISTTLNKNKHCNEKAKIVRLNK